MSAPPSTAIASRAHYASALALCVLLAAGGVYLLADECVALATALDREQILVRFRETVLFFPGAMIALAGASIICIAGSTGRSLPLGLRRTTHWSFVVSLALAVGGMLAGAWLVDSHVEARGYRDCEPKSVYTPLRRSRAWALDPAICESTTIPETLTLTELKTLLRGSRHD